MTLNYFKWIKQQSESIRHELSFSAEFDTYGPNYMYNIIFFVHMNNEIMNMSFKCEIGSSGYLY